MSCEASSAQSTTQPRLSKSKIAAFQHCSRRLWLQVHRPNLARFDEATLALFACGHQVGAVARWRYPDGVLVAEDHRDLVAALARTRLLLKAPLHIPIFEAAFERNGVVIRADILEPDGWGGWRLIEVKNAAGVRPHHVSDVATQHWVLRGTRICISSAILRHVARPLGPFRVVSAPPQFIDVDVTREVFKLTAERAAVIGRARETVLGPEPSIMPGAHCVKPFRCEFREHCWGDSASP